VDAIGPVIFNLKTTDLAESPAVSGWTGGYCFKL